MILRNEHHAEEVRRAVEKKAGEGAEVLIQKIPDNNGEMLTGIIVRMAGRTAAPIVYLERLPSDSVEEAADMVLACQDLAEGREVQESAARAEELTKDKETVLAHVLPRVINHDWNREMLEGLPHREFLDLAVVYIIPLGNGASMKLKHGNADSLGITEEELYDASMRNAEDVGYKIMGLSEVIEDVFSASEAAVPPDLRELPYEMLVIRDRDWGFGSRAILSGKTLRQAADRIGQDLYIFPSSIYEIIVTGKGETVEPDRARELVRSINRDAISKNERLSDNAYIFERATGRVRIA